MTDYKLVPMEATHKDMESVWMYKGSDGEWKPFTNEQHRLNTIADGGWEVREFFAAPIVHGKPVGYIRRSAIELMEGDELGVRANIIKEPRYRDCVALYTVPQPAEQQMQPDNLIGRTVSMDVSTGDHDAFHRLFGVVTGVEGQDGVILCEMTDDNKDAQPAPNVADYEQVLDDHRRLTRELDVLLNGEEGAAQQASLVDMVVQLRTVVRNTGKPVLAAPDVAGLVEALEASPHRLYDSIDGEDDCRCSECKFVRLRDAALAAYRKRG